MVLFAKRWMIIISFLLSSLLLFSSFAQASPEAKLVMTVKVSAEAAWETRLELNDPQLMKAAEHSRNRSSVLEIPVSDTYLTLTSNGQTTTYLIDHLGNVFDEQRMEMLQLKDSTRSKLVQHAESLRKAHYGSYVEWSQAKQILPKQIKFKVLDMETGLSFHAQRRAGSSHADVQPLTKEDTAIMKQIYGGVWSWNRRSILVVTDNQRLAASMHGMPHGGDGIPDNDFSGHFCIHFPGSSTHGSGKVDPGHQLMAYKAAGKLDEYLGKLSPEELIDTFFLALNLEDRHIVKKSFTHGHHKQLSFFLPNEKSVRWTHKIAAASRSNEELSNSLAAEIPVDVRMSRKNHKEEKLRLTFQLKRSSLTEPWQIEAIGMVSAYIPHSDYKQYFYHFEK